MPAAFARNTLLAASSGVAAALAGFIGSVIAARLLGPAGVGVIAYAGWCVMVAAPIVGLGGIAFVLQRFIPNLRAEGKHDEAEDLIGAAARLSTLATIVGSLLLFAWLYWPGRSAMEAPSQAPRIVLIVLVLAWFIGSGLAAVYTGYLKGEQRFGEFARLSTVSALIRLLVTVLGAWLFGVAGGLAAGMAAYALPASRISRLLRKRPRVGHDLRRHVMRFGLTSWAVGAIAALVWGPGRAEVVFLEHYAGIGVVGIFAAAATLADMAMQLPGLLLPALLPYLSEQYGLGAHDKVHRLYRVMMGILALVMMPCCIGIAAIAPVLVPLLFGAEFADAVPVAMVLMIAASVIGVGVTPSNLIYSTGKIGLLPISNGLGLAATIVFGFLVIPHFGLIGAACSRAVAQVLVVAIETWYVTSRLGVAPPYRALGAITLAAVIQGAVAYGLVSWLGGVTSLVLAIPAAVVVYLVALRTIAVLPMLDPALVDTVIADAPRRARRAITWILRLASPATTGRDRTPD